MRNKSQGFTLIELLIIIAIIGILAAVLIPNLLSARERANETSAQAYIRNTAVLIESLRNPNSGALPADTDCDALDGAGAQPAAIDTCTYTDNGDETYSINVTLLNGTNIDFNGDTTVISR